MNSQIAIDYINSHTLTGIKAGLARESFLDIWMVVVDNRIFARSWGFAERSWYNSFLQDPNGQLKCGERIIPIKALIPTDNAEMTDKINAAYLSKYNSEHNIEYAQGITQSAHIERTMEFVVLEA